MQQGISIGCRAAALTGERASLAQRCFVFAAGRVLAVWGIGSGSGSAHSWLAVHSAGSSNTATTAARIFSRLDSVEEVQRGRSGSAVGITPGGGAVAAAAAAVAAGSPARTGGGGVGAGLGNAAGARNRSASTILELSQSQLGAHTRKYSSGGGAALLAGDVNGYGDNASTAKCDTFNGVGASAVAHHRVTSRALRLVRAAELVAQRQQ
ncbi:alanine and glycine-rich protein-like [Drosophila navojoa]|uniref:alanine and glycine-rich protein-like n=1 Tax=Drosophila navojoa TaxID=7232 RepID=UPI0011BF57E0|nr:alanine and glycine-rich protein-like [Drosophila navojoa]